MSQREKSCQGEPEFITYLLSPEVKHDTYFLVGKDRVERIGAVRKMLAAHSIVFRAELEDSYLKEKGVITVNDIFPDTFRNLLKFVYGHNNIRSLKFEEADDLLYAADKYCMEKMKNQLALQLMPLLNSQNICSLLNNPACHTVLELNAKITEILQWETHDVLASPPFIHLRVEGFVKILEQECLNVPEIQLFRSALAWAKNRDENRLRKQLEELKHIRILTIGLQDFLGEVVPSGILTSDEVVQSCIFYGKGETPPAIAGFSNNTKSRFNSEPLELEITDTVNNTTRQLESVILSITTKSRAVGLLPLEIQANSRSSVQWEGEYRCVCDVEILDESVEGAAPKTVKFDELVTRGGIFTIPLEKNRMYLKLSPNSSYRITMSLNEPHTFYYVRQSCSNDDLSINPLKPGVGLGSRYRTTHRGYLNQSSCFLFKSLKYVRLYTT